jgi:hypothetical protein
METLMHAGICTNGWPIKNFITSSNLEKAYHKADADITKTAELLAV